MLQYARRTLTFSHPATTSRGTYLTHRVWYLRRGDSYGECAPLPGLSTDADIDYDRALADGTYRHHAAGRTALEGTEQPAAIPDARIKINGLVWMGSKRDMLRGFARKADEGFEAVKLKIGGIAWEEELDILRTIRREHPTLELRLDANGAFTPDNALQRLERLADYGIHSLEQPIAAGQLEAMARLCRLSPIPIALDEELIGVGADSAAQLLDDIAPAYIVLKPTLLGGFRAADRWIEAARERGIGWWATSALESPVGLAAIFRWLAPKGVTLPQGLGTGEIYADPLGPMPLRRREQWLEADPDFSRYSLPVTWHTL